MAYEFWDAPNNTWNQVAPDDPIYSQGAPSDMKGQSGWDWHGKNLEGQQYRVAQETGGDEGGMNLADLTPKEYSGPPKWLNDYAQSTVTKYQPGFLDAVQNAINTIKAGSPYDSNVGTMAQNMVDAYGRYATQYDPLIEEIRTRLPQQFLAAQPTLEQKFQPVLEQMGARGMLNSKATSDALATVASDLQNLYGQNVLSANTWAAQQQLADLAQRPQVAGQVTGTLKDLADSWLKRIQTQGALGVEGSNSMNTLASLARYGESTNPAAALNALLPLLMGTTSA